MREQGTKRPAALRIAGAFLAALVAFSAVPASAFAQTTDNSPSAEELTQAVSSSNSTSEVSQNSESTDLALQE